MSLQDVLSTETVRAKVGGNPLRGAIRRWLNRGLTADRAIDVRIGWPLWLLPLLLLNQLVAPHVVWVVLLITLGGFYLLAYLWVRNQAPVVELTRRRIGTILVAGDVLQEEFEVQNSGPLPLLWAEFTDASNVPGYSVGRIVACEGENAYRWRTEVLCQRRGLFRLGPHSLRLQDPLGIFGVEIVEQHEDVVLIYPRVVHLPPLQLVRGNTQGGDRQRSPLLGNLPAATVSEYKAGDSLRYVHWASSARRGRMMVKDLEIEQGGNIWLVLNLDGAAQQGDGTNGTLEQGIVVAASLAAELLGGRDQPAVGLLAYSGEEMELARGGLVEVMPSVGSAHLWPILSALAPVSTGELPLGQLLASSRNRIGRRSTLTVVTPLPGGEPGDHDTADSGVGAPANDHLDWVAELVHLKGVGVNSSVILIAPVGGEPRAADEARSMLAQLGIACSVITAGTSLPSLLTFRRRRRIVRTTPTGGAVSYEIDEEVG